MTSHPVVPDPIEAIAALGEPTRRALYDLVVVRHEPVGRDDAAATLGISRELAAFHLDRLVEAGLLRTEYHRRSGRTGPGAGRPAKFYRRSDTDLEVALPSRDYGRAAAIMADALGRLADGTGASTLVDVARERGAAVGVEARHRLRGRLTNRRRLAGLIDAFRGAGFEPSVEADGSVCLRNCPYDALVADHRDLTCGMNLAWTEGVVEGLGLEDVRARLEPLLGRCCVIIQAGQPTAGDPAAATEPRAGSAAPV